MKALFRIGVVIALSGGLVACALQPAADPGAVETSTRTKLIAPDRPKETVTVGRSTKADVIAALGETLVISFDNGYEVWVYRLADAATRAMLAQRIFGSRKAERETTAEFVILFAPSGVVAKTRIRPAPPRA